MRAFLMKSTGVSGNASVKYESADSLDDKTAQNEIESKRNWIAQFLFIFASTYEILKSDCSSIFVESFFFKTFGLTNSGFEAFLNSR